MPGFDGNGNFTRQYSWVQDAANGLFIDASRMDGDWSYITAGFNNCLTRDGQGRPSAAINWNAQNLTNVAALGVNGTATLGGLSVVGTTALTGTASVSGAFAAASTVAINRVAQAGYVVDIGGQNNTAGGGDPVLRISSLSQTVATNYGWDFLGASGTYLFTVAGTEVGRFTASGWQFTAPLPLASGGTGANNASSARTNLGLGSNALGNRFVQAIGSDPTSAPGDIVFEY